jgi:hypothetical protein
MKIWCAAAALFIAVVATVNLWSLAQRVAPPPHFPDANSDNAVVKLERRLAPVRSALIARGIRGPIAYCTDVAPAELAANDAAMAEYFQSQFVLAPWILDPRLGDCRWGVANFHTADSRAQLPAGFRVAEDWGQGVLLLERSAP